MKFLTTVSILFAVFSNFVSAQTNYVYTKFNENQESIRKAGIRSASLWEYYYLPGNENCFRDSGFKSLSFIYDEFGRVTEYTKHHVYAPLTVKEMYSYNKTGKISNTTRLNSNGDVIEIIDFKYSKRGMLVKQIHSAYYNSVRVGVYFTITANVNDLDLFSKLQDELQIEPKLESYMITVNITDPEELNRYVVIGDEGEASAMRFSWSQLSIESQKGLLGYEGPNRKENSYKSKFISETAYKYDKSRNLKSRTVFNTAGDLIGKEKYYYNINNKITNYYKYGEDGKLSSMESYVYEETGKLSENIGMDAYGKIVSRLRYGYSASGNLYEKYWISGEGNISGKFLYDYDSQNRLKEEKKLRDENEIEYRNEYYYDVFGNTIEIIRFNINGNREKLWKFIFTGN